MPVESKRCPIPAEIARQKSDVDFWLSASNELRVCAARSRRTNSVGRTRGVGERMGLWRFHPGRSLSGVMIAGQKERREERDRRITVESVTFCTVDGVIWGMVRDIGWGGDKGFP